MFFFGGVVLISSSENSLVWAMDVFFYRNINRVTKAKWARLHVHLLKLIIMKIPKATPSHKKEEEKNEEEQRLRYSSLLARAQCDRNRYADVTSGVRERSIYVNPQILGEIVTRYIWNFSLENKLQQQRERETSIWN